jgi:hypothetical protein
LSAGALLATAVPVLADSSRWDHNGYRGHRAHERMEHRPAVVERRTVVVHQEPRYYGRQRYVEPVYAPAPAPYYTEAPAPYYYAQEPYYGEPAYYGSRDNTAAIIGGAAIGAAIGSQVGHRSDRAATTAIGALLGGLIGGSLR